MGSSLGDIYVVTDSQCSVTASQGPTTPALGSVQESLLGGAFDGAASNCSASLALGSCGESTEFRPSTFTVADLERLSDPSNPGLEAFGRPVLDCRHEELEIPRENQSCMLQRLPQKA